MSHDDSSVSVGGSVDLTTAAPAPSDHGTEAPSRLSRTFEFSDEPAEESGAEPARAPSSRRNADWVVLAFILIVAGLLRFKGVDWGGNLYLHPDERFQTMVVTRIAWPSDLSAFFDSANSPLNPYNRDFTTYIYGTFPLFVAKLLGALTGNEVYGNVHLPARIAGGVCDLFSVLLVFLIGRRLFGSRTGLLAAALLAVTVMHVQAAHFFAPDLYVVVFCLAAFCLALKAEAKARWWWYAAAGVAASLAIASKINALPIVAVLALPALERARRTGLKSVGRSTGPGQLSPLLGLGVALIAAIWTFRVAQPYAFTGPSLLSFRLDQRWLDDISYWREVQRGSADTPPALQWANRAPILFGLKNLVLWGMGPLLGVSAIGASLFAGFIALSRRRLPPIWLLFLVGWPAFHLLYYGVAFVQTMRYVLPAYPFLILLAAAGLTRLARHGNRRRWPTLPLPRGKGLPIGAAPAVAVLLLTTLYAFGFSGIYDRPTTREAATRWIYANVPAGSVIAAEHWDDAIPVRLPELDSNAYQGIQLELFFTDDERKLTTLLNQLEHADYIVVTSNRLYDVIPRIPERYPMTSRYYELLFSGQLGFELVHRETSYPSLFGFELVDDGAEEAFTVYDHPKVLIFRKSDDYSRAAIEAPLASALGAGGYGIAPLEVGVDLLLMDDETRAEQERGGTWRRMFDADNLANRAPVLVWYLAMQVMALAALPLCWRLFDQLPDRGYAVSKTVGLLLVSYGAWLLASIGAVHFGRTAIVLGIAGTAGLSLGLAHGRWRELIADLRQRGRLVVATEALFLFSFLITVWLRMQNPDLWHRSRGGEKPMDFAYFNAVLRSTSFPAFDPWFAGGYLNYYYFGFVQWASVTRLTGIVPEVAYNLAIPAILALLCINLWSVVIAIVARARPSTTPFAVSGRLLAIALAAPVFVVALGNLDLARRVGQGEFGYPAGELTGRLPFPDALADLLAGIGNAVVHRPPLPDDIYWSATRLVPGTINEFPLFTFLYGDLHAHMMAMPLAATVLLLAAQLALSARSPSPGPFDRPASSCDSSRAIRRRRFSSWNVNGQRLLELGSAGLLTSALYATNTWDYPTYLAIVVAAVLIREGVSRQWRVSWPMGVRVGLQALAIIAIGRIAFWPFYTSFHTRTGVVRFNERTDPGDYLTIHGVMLFAIGCVLAIRVVDAIAAAGTKSRGSPLQTGWWGNPGIIDWPVNAGAASGVLGQLANPVVVGGLLSVAVLSLGLISSNLPLFLLGALILVAAVAWAERHEPARLMLALIVGVALALSLVVEFVTLEGDIGRMNTVFKLYLQVWLLLGVAAAVAVALVVTEPGRRRGSATRVWGLALAALVLAAGVYPALSIPARVGDRFTDLPPTLDGMAYLESAVYSDAPENRAPVEFSLAGDAAAFDWLRQNIDGSPVVLEASIPGYRWGSRVSVYTGLPTVLGWDWHQTQQRPGLGMMIQERRDDVGRMLGETGSFEAIRPLLDRYHVRLIYIGDLERAYYASSALAKFDAAAAAGDLTVIYQQDGVTIYAYDGRA